MYARGLSLLSCMKRWDFLLIGRPYINMDLNKCMNKALQQWCSWLRINGRRCSSRWIHGFSMCVTRTGKESESHSFPSCDWGSCAWWWAFNCPCHSCDAVLWPAHQKGQISFCTGPEVLLSCHHLETWCWCHSLWGMTSPWHHMTPELHCVTAVTSKAGVTVKLKQWSACLHDFKPKTRPRGGSSAAQLWLWCHW